MIWISIGLLLLLVGVLYYIGRLRERYEKHIKDELGVVEKSENPRLYYRVKSARKNENCRWAKTKGFTL